MLYLKNRQDIQQVKLMLPLMGSGHLVMAELLTKEQITAGLSGLMNQELKVVEMMQKLVHWVEELQSDKNLKKIK
jgi:hypothetical protein